MLDSTCNRFPSQHSLGSKHVTHVWYSRYACAVYVVYKLIGVVLMFFDLLVLFEFLPVQVIKVTDWTVLSV